MSIVSNFFARLIARELQLTPEQWPVYVKDTQQTQHTILRQSQMPLNEFNTLLSNALRISNDPGFGLRFGRHSNLLALGESGLAGIAAPTLIDAIRSLGDFSRLQADYLDLEVQVGRQLNLKAREHLPMGNTRRTQHEVLVLMIQNVAEMIMGRPLTEACYHFSYPPPEYVERYRDTFHSPCCFDAEVTGVVLPRELCNFPSPFYDQTLWEKGRSLALKLMQEFHNQNDQLHSYHILSMLRSQVPPLPTAIQVALSMNLSERTMMRRLAAEKQTYRKLQNRVLQEWAHHYLTQTQLTIDVIAQQLGYQDTANFRRAFKRWHGCSPNDYRYKNQ